jgi:hypothetical protein
MNVAPAIDPSHTLLPSPSSQTASVSASRQTSTATAKSQELDMTITTADGDRFTLSSSTFSADARATYSELGSNAASLSLKQSSTQAHTAASSLSMTLEGNFSKEEMHDIAKALKQITQALHDLLTGHLKQAARKVEKLMQLDSLSSVETSYQVSSVTVQKQQTEAKTAIPIEAPATA